MKFGITVGSVSGDEMISLETNDLGAVRRFLAQHDHEGSVVGLDVECQTSIEAYNLLTVLQRGEQDKTIG